MVQNIFDIGERENRVINIVKAQHGLKTKSEAVAVIAQAYEDTFLEPQLRSGYLKKLDKIRKGKYKKFSSIEELRKATS
ncbi:MAG: DUF2683 family protein [Nanoarchaeota archaeon]|nr:DUF2683 family protein [Nanoarchaeota archaeon]MBU1103921.1 DUF2683 family protein [Nanoarchaeota archaeon]